MSSDQREIPIERIMRPKASLRPIRRDAPEYIEMLESVRKDGVLQPILVRPCDPSTGYDYEIIEGWHRYEASKENGLETIPVIIKEMTDHEVLVVQLKLNSIRPKTQTFEYARRLKLLMEGGLTIVELSSLIDKGQAWIRDQLQLNRLCEEARPPVERGEIKMRAALALANLPEDLQPKFVDEAVALEQPQFVERAQHALRDFRAYLQRVHEEDKADGIVQPHLRPVNVLKREAVKPENAKAVLKAAGAKTALDGWRAGLAWAFSIDPITVKTRGAGKKESKNEEKLATRKQHQEMTRSLIEQFVRPHLEPGDQNHGEQKE
jgi:ParB/RepB/Spo0J family partition protein